MIGEIPGLCTYLDVPSYSYPLIALSCPLRYRTIVLSSRLYILYNKFPPSTSSHQLHSQLYPVRSCVGNLYRSVSILHTYASYPHALAVVFWYPRLGVSARFPTSHIPFSSKILLHAGTQEKTPPPHTFMTCIMDHSHIDPVGANIPRC